MFSAHEAAEICRVSAAGKAPMDLARELARDGSCFFLTRDGEPRFPTYQFSAAGKKPIVGKLLETLSLLRSSWEIAVWFRASNGWLDGKSPEEFLDSEPDLVLDAALQEVVEETE